MPSHLYMANLLVKDGANDELFISIYCCVAICFVLSLYQSIAFDEKVRV